MADEQPSLSRHLTRIQVLTPLSILLNLASLAVCSVVTRPRLGDVNEEHVTQFTPNPAFILFYWAVLFLLQIGFAILAVAGQKDFTRHTLAYGVGIRLALANLFLGGWAIAWVVNTRISFLAGLVLLCLNGFTLLVTAVLLAAKYPASKSRPLDWLFIHAPIKMFLVITVQLDIPQMLFMALGWDYEKPAGKDMRSGEHGRGTPDAAMRALWPSFGILTGMGALSAIWIFAASDVTWAVCGIYLHFALLYSKAPPLHRRPPEIVAAIILAATLQAIALIGSMVHRAVSPAHGDGEGRIALGRSPQEEAAAARQEAEADAAAALARERALSHTPPPASSAGGHATTNGAEEEADASALERGDAHSANGVKVSRTLGSPRSKK